MINFFLYKMGKNFITAKAAGVLDNTYFLCCGFFGRLRRADIKQKRRIKINVLKKQNIYQPPAGAHQRADESRGGKRKQDFREYARFPITILRAER